MYLVCLSNYCKFTYLVSIMLIFPNGFFSLSHPKRGENSFFIFSCNLELFFSHCYSHTLCPSSFDKGIFSLSLEFFPHIWQIRGQKCFHFSPFFTRGERKFACNKFLWKGEKHPKILLYLFPLLRVFFRRERKKWNAILLRLLFAIRCKEKIQIIFHLFFYE